MITTKRYIVNSGNIESVCVCVCESERDIGLVTIEKVSRKPFKPRKLQKLDILRP